MRNILIMTLIAVAVTVSGCHHHHRHHKKGKMQGLMIEEEILRFQTIPPRLDIILPPEPGKVEVIQPSPEKPKEDSGWWWS